MNWLGALLVGSALLVLAVAIGVAWSVTSGRVRRLDPGSSPASTEARATTDALGISGDELGARATLVQLSTEFCSRCPGAARQLTRIAAEYEGVRHVEVDITNRADLADRFRVLQTPTTLILDADGVSTARIGGAPRSHEVREHLDRLTRSDRVPS